MDLFHECGEFGDLMKDILWNQQNNKTRSYPGFVILAFYELVDTNCSSKTVKLQTSLNGLVPTLSSAGGLNIIESYKYNRENYKNKIYNS
ncbi:MAG TPA: hypothetical protein VJ203_13735 [Bacteroidales bacterium]|nr:hypothetical protein [Bacteroidales bacterium]